MEDRRFAAMEANDTVALEQVLADDLHYTHANGMVEDKAEVVRRIASGERVYQKVRMIEREVSPQNGFIAVYGKVLMEVSRAAGLLVTQLEYTAIYRDHDPRLFAWQATKSYAP
ncbi:nuclear transport factor 2 family protein [Sphingopyxis granuli]|nr:nuclear transport factor 2 family protein [Sphingopyxis granuli]